MLSQFRLTLKYGLPTLLIIAALLIAKQMMDTAPKQKTRSAALSAQIVEVDQIQASDYRTYIHTQGTIAPRTQTRLIAEVSGRITSVSPQFRAGSFVAKDETLLEIDNRDYVQSLTIAKAELAQARLSLSQEQAKGIQAREDWDKLGFEGSPNALTLRKPQAESAQARVAAARASVAQARTKLSRTKIIAPYAGRLLSTEVDIAQFVSAGALLGQLYATDSVELRVPISEQDSAFLQLDESYRDSSEPTLGPRADIRVEQGGREWHWAGKVARAEGTIDIQTRQQFVVIAIPDPYLQYEDGRPPLKIGQFARVSIEGIVLKNVYTIPREYVYGDQEIQVVDMDNRVERRKVDRVWQDEKYLVIASGLLPEERIIKTPLGFATNGMQVSIIDSASAEHSSKRGKGKKGKKGGKAKHRNKGKDGKDRDAKASSK